jgi:hypothetical protein
MSRLAIASCLLGWTLCLFATSAQATLKGLNQIVTPDIQPTGQLSLSLQAENSAVGNSQQFQTELGVVKRVEVGYYAGFHPGDNLFHAEVGLIQQKHLLLSTGLLNWSARGNSPQAFLEAGYYTGRLETMAGTIDAQHHMGMIFGSAYQLNEKLQLSADYQSGKANFATAGFQWDITGHLQLNPALYISNGANTKVYPYAVLTWNIALWNPDKADKPATAPATAPATGTGAAAKPADKPKS